MTVAERMRRDGWVRLDRFVWRKITHGSLATICPQRRTWAGTMDAAGFISVHDTDGDRGYVATGMAHGLRSLAQRAKSAARRLARKGER